MSFRLSFHLPPLGPTGAHWLDDSPDLSCMESTRQHPWTIRACLVNSRLGFEAPPAPESRGTVGRTAVTARFMVRMGHLQADRAAIP